MFEHVKSKPAKKLSTILNNIVEPESGERYIVDNIEQCEQQNIAQSCFYQS